MARTGLTISSGRLLGGLDFSALQQFIDLGKAGSVSGKLECALVHHFPCGLNEAADCRTGKRGTHGNAAHAALLQDPLR